MKNEKLELLKKKALALTAAGVMAFSLTSCSLKKEENNEIQYAVIRNGDTYIVMQIDKIEGDNYGATHRHIHYDGVEYTIPMIDLFIINSKNAKEDAINFANALAGENAEVVIYEDYVKKFGK